jgi:Arc-like DNA binding domain
MGKRGPTAQAPTTVSTTLRLDAGVRSRIDAAARKRHESMAYEIETRLDQSFADEFAVADQFGDRQILAVARMVFATAKATVNVNRKSGFSGWLDDPAAFDAAVAAINKVFELIRPAGAVGKPESRPGAIEPAPDVVTAPDQRIGVTYQPAFNAEELVREIATAPPVAPVRASRHVLATVALRKDLGDAVLDRAGGVRARARSTWAKEYGPLRRKQAKAPDTITNEELQRMRALEAEAERMLR